MDSANGSDRAAAFLSTNIDVSLPLKLVHLLMTVFSMNLAKNFTPNYVTPLLESDQI